MIRSPFWWLKDFIRFCDLYRIEITILSLSLNLEIVLAYSSPIWYGIVVIMLNLFPKFDWSDSKCKTISLPYIRLLYGRPYHVARMTWGLFLAIPGTCLANISKISVVSFMKESLFCIFYMERFSVLITLTI